MRAGLTPAESLPPLPAGWQPRMEVIGRMCFGTFWRDRMCEQLGVSRVLLARWRSRKSTPPPDLDARLGRVIHGRLLFLAAFRDAVSPQLDVEHVIDDEHIFGD